MKLLRFGEPGRERPGVLDVDGTARDISAVIDDLAGVALTRHSLEGLRRINFKSLPRVPQGTRFGPCVGGTRNFIAVGLNYSDHAAESNMPIPTEPILFNKAPSCIVGPNDDILLPRGSVATDWEVELACVVGEHASYVSETDASQVIAGYCVCHDLSERTYQLERGGQWMKGKGCPTFGPLGPYLVTPDEIKDVQALDLWLDVNGQSMQRGSTSKMIFGVHRILSYASQFMALEPGDVITTGTPPGVGLGMKPPKYLKAGDEVKLGITGLGEQQQRIIASRE